MSEWAGTTLGEVCELKRGYDLPKRERRDGPYPIVSSSGTTGYHAESKVEAPGVVTGRYGTLGQVFFVTEDFWPLNTSLYVRDFKGNNPRFVAALLESMDLERHDGAAAVPGLNRNQLHELPVLRPDPDTQDSIAAVLETIDDLVENNRRRIEVLEGIAQAIYQEWFVHFRYPGHEDATVADSPLGPIPEGWEVQQLFDAAEVGFGYSFKSKFFAEDGRHPVIRIRDVPRGSTATFSDEDVDERYQVNDGDVLIGMDGDFHLRQWTGGAAWLNQRVARLRPAMGLSARHLQLAIAAPIRQLNESISGTTVAHLGKRHLERLEVVVPSTEVLDRARELFDDCSGQECKLFQANQRLAAIRDLLLPKLVTGEIDVSALDLDALVEAAS